MAMTLYFANCESRTCWPVPNCIGNPIPEDVERMSGPFRNNYQMVAETAAPSGQGNVIGHNGKVVFPGRMSGFKAATENLVPASIAGVWAGSMKVLGAVENDEAAGEGLRQSELQFTHWKVSVEAEEGEPGYCLISMDQYPDGYSNSPPNWWSDAAATVA